MKKHATDVGGCTIDDIICTTWQEYFENCPVHDKQYKKSL